MNANIHPPLTTVMAAIEHGLKLVSKRWSGEHDRPRSLVIW